jgi:hypothetical protein
MGLTLLLVCVVVGCMATESQWRQTLMQKVGEKKKEEKEKSDISLVVGLN